MRAAAIRREFDIAVCEAVDRPRRRLADTADSQDTLAFNGIRLVTPSRSEISTIHVAVDHRRPATQRNQSAQFASDMHARERQAASEILA